MCLPAAEPVTLSEGWTPMLPSRRHSGLFVKEEGHNPTGTIRARGLSMAVTMARHHGLKHLAIASAGDAGGALAAYAAAAEVAAHIFMPKDVPLASYLEVFLYGAGVVLVDGMNSDCERLLTEAMMTQKESGLKATDVWLDVSTLKEPYRIEGEKTVGYELVEQLGWVYPDAVLYPTAAGAGMIGIWKAFEEMEQLGWVRGKRPRMYTLQEEGTVPVLGNVLLSEIVRESGGRVVTSTAAEVLASLREWATEEGLFLCPEGAAAAAGYEKLLASGEIKSGERVVLLNTGAGLKYVDTVAEAMRLRRPETLPTSLPVGGIITPV